MAGTPSIEGNLFLQNETIKPLNLFRREWYSYHKVIYEVIRVIRGQPIFLNHHLSRLEKSCVLSGYPSPSIEPIKKSLLQFVAQQHFTEKNIRVSLCFDASISNAPMLLAYYIASHYPTQHQYQMGVKVSVLHEHRAQPNVKAHNPDLRKVADSIIDREDVHEVLLVNKEGFITEGSRSNFFAIKNSTLITPPSSAVLEGITRSIVLEIARNNGIPYSEEYISLESIGTLSGAFLTGTSPGVLPICCIKDLSLSIPGITKDLIRMYGQAMQAAESLKL